MQSKKMVKPALAIIASVIFAASAWGSDDDGFGAAVKASGAHVVVWCQPGVDVPKLVRELNVRPSEEILAGKDSNPHTSPESDLVDSLDTLFTQVCDITDMRLYSLKVNVKICRDYKNLSSVYKGMFGSDLGGRKSFYAYNMNSLYIPADDFRRELVGHEMAHAIINHYFVVQPPVKVQEVLAMYVEYCLRKKYK
jgi:hypothetical protein